MKIVSVISIPRENGSTEYLLTATQAELDTLARICGQIAVDPCHAMNVEIQLPEPERNKL